MLKVSFYFLKKKDPSLFRQLNWYKLPLVIQIEQYGFASKPLFKTLFSELCKNACVKKRYTPQCIRATTFQRLNDSGLEARHIMILSGYKNESSLGSYSKID